MSLPPPQGVHHPIQRLSPQDFKFQAHRGGRQFSPPFTDGRKSHQKERRIQPPPAADRHPSPRKQGRMSGSGTDLGDSDWSDLSIPTDPQTGLQGNPRRHKFTRGRIRPGTGRSITRRDAGVVRSVHLAFIHHSLIHSFIYSLFDWFFPSFALSFIRPFIRSSIHSFVLLSFVHSFIHSFIFHSYLHFLFASSIHEWMNSNDIIGFCDVFVMETQDRSGGACPHEWTRSVLNRSSKFPLTCLL